MAKIVKGSIEVRKLDKPYRFGKHTFRYEIFYTTYPYGLKSPMRHRTSQLATDKKDADAWVRTLKKEEVKLRGMM